MRPASLFVLVLAALLLIPSVTLTAAAQGEVEVGGIVRDTGGSPLAGVTVTAVSVPGSGPGETAISDKDGTFALMLVPGTYDISASNTSYRSERDYSDFSIASARNGLQFTMLPRLGTVLGHVSDDDGGIANATVSMVGSGNEYSGRTNETGHYRIDNVLVGIYTVSITAVMGGDLKILEVVEGENVQNWNLTGQSTLRGVVRSVQEPLGDVEVTISSATYSQTVTTSSNGRYEINNIPAGEYTITFTKSGYQSSESPVDLRLPKYYTLDMEMERAGLPISEGFLAGYDMPHSLMIVALGMAVGTLVFALLVRHRIKRSPEMLSEDESD